MKTKGKTFIVVMSVIALTFVIAVVSVLSASSKKAGNWQRQAQQTIFSVRTQKAAVETLHDFVTTNGEIESQTSVDVFADIGGIVAEVLVSLGSPVTKGQVIARVDPSAPGMQYALSPVLSPITGSVVTTPKKRGTTVTTSTAVTTVGDIDNLQIVSYIPERFVAYLKTGLKADVSLEAYPDAVFKATVIRVSPVLDASSRTKEIILTFDKKDERINAGMFAKVVLYTQTYSGLPVVSNEAVVSNENKNYIFVTNDDTTAERREVVLGKEVSGKVQIVSGLYEGEDVVVEGASILADGAKIKNLSKVQSSTENSATDSSTTEPSSAADGNGKPAGKGGKK